MATRRTLDVINDRVKPKRTFSGDGHLNPNHLNSQTRHDDDYLTPTQTNNPNRADDVYLELRDVNNQTIGSAGQYYIIDYDLLRRDDPRQDQHTYRGLKFDDKEEIKKGTARPHRSEKIEVHSTSEKKKGGNRVFILIIAVLAVLLVAMAATFGFLYTDVNDNEGSSESKQHDTRKTLVTSTVATTTTAATTSTTVATITTTTATTTTTETISIRERCQSCDGLIPHPEECQAYYNCSDTSFGFGNVMATNFELYLNECPYPQLFSTETMACEHFEDVDCGDREEFIDACDYRAIRCASSHCYQCSIRYPMCKGKMDGINMHDDRPWTPYYIICYKERFVTQLTCPRDPNAAIATQYFSPEYGGCVSLERVPQEHGRYKPNCTGKADGKHPDNYGRCSHYTICAFGQYVGFEACPSGTAFDEVTNTCTSDPYLCECANIC